jgi:hypothetical protein
MIIQNQILQASKGAERIAMLAVSSLFRRCPITCEKNAPVQIEWKIAEVDRNNNVHSSYSQATSQNPPARIPPYHRNMQPPRSIEEVHTPEHVQKFADHLTKGLQFTPSPDFTTHAAGGASSVPSQLASIRTPEEVESLARHVLQGYTACPPSTGTANAGSVSPIHSTTTAQCAGKGGAHYHHHQHQQHHHHRRVSVCNRTHRGTAGGKRRGGSTVRRVYRYRLMG